MSELTIVYLKSPTLNPEYFAQFQACLQDCPYDVIELPAIKDNLQVARIAGYKAVKSEFVLFVDPDDLIDIKVVAKALQMLKDDPKLVMCAIRSEDLYTAADGTQRRAASMDNIETVMHDSPRNMHVGNMYRTQVVKDALPKFTQHNYALFDWALRLVVSRQGKIALTDEVGYTWRIHPEGDHQRKVCPPGQVTPRATVRTLVQSGAYEIYCPVRHAQRQRLPG